jgi:hypothetical protein
MRKILLIHLLSLLVVCNESFGQEKFTQAYIITNEHDTIQGEILNKIDSKLAFEVLFKDEAPDSEVKTYFVSDLVGFKFNNGRTFERINFSSNKQDTISVFAKKTLTGKIDMWIWRHSKNELDIFLENNSNQIFAHLTKPDDKTISEDGRKYVQHDYKVIGQIINITNNEYKPSSRSKDLKYSEKNITDNISLINQKYEKQIPFNKYNEKFEFKHDIFIGIPIQLDSKSTEFKLGFFRRKIKVEKSRSFSTIIGITYYRWHEHGSYDDSRWQLINILPLGLHFQRKHKTIKPYAYAGFGLAILAISDYQKIVGYQNTGSKTTFLPHPTVYVGVGLQIKIGSNYLFAEVTPSVWNSSISIGYGF